MQNKRRTFTKLISVIGNTFYEEKLSRAIQSATDDKSVLKRAIDIFHINLDKGCSNDESVRLTIETVFSNNFRRSKIAIDSAKIDRPFKNKACLALTCLLVPPAAIFVWIVIKRLQLVDPNPPEDY